MGVEEKEFLALLSEKKHKEVITILTKILDNLVALEKGDTVVEVDVSRIEEAVRAINSSQPDYSEIPNSIRTITSVLVTKLENLKTGLAQEIAKELAKHKLKPKRLKVVRDELGRLDLVDVEYY